MLTWSANHVLSFNFAADQKAIFEIIHIKYYVSVAALQVLVISKQTIFRLLSQIKFS